MARVFQTDAGRELLAEWDKTHVEGRTFRADPIEMAGRAAAKDFVSDIHSILREVRNWKS